MLLSHPRSKLPSNGPALNPPYPLCPAALAVLPMPGFQATTLPRLGSPQVPQLWSIAILSSNLDLTPLCSLNRGYTAVDPRADLSGLDTARRLLSVARHLSLPLQLSDIALHKPLTPERLQDWECPSNRCPSSLLTSLSHSRWPRSCV